MQLSQDHLTNFNTNNPVAGSDLHTAESEKPSNNDSEAGLCSRLIMYNSFFFLINHTIIPMTLWLNTGSVLIKRPSKFRS